MRKDPPVQLEQILGKQGEVISTQILGTYVEIDKSSLAGRN
jgi:hypothetical protein